MRKKIAAILPLYLAGMILLAFAVFPHHHHESYICFNAIHCQAENNGEQAHHHNETSEKGHCVQYLFQTDHVKTSARYLEEAGEKGIPHHFMFICCTFTQRLSVSFPANAPNLLPDASDDILRQLLLSSSEYTRGPPCKG